MDSFPNGAPWRAYLRVLGDTAVDAASAGAWIAAGGLSPARRRLARAGLVAATAATAIPAFRSAAARAEAAGEPPTPAPGPLLDATGVVGDRIVLPDAVTVPQRPTPRQVAKVAAVVAVAGAVSVGAALGGKQVEKRWLARLVRQGHPHPHRALGIRMAAVWAAAVLPARLLTATKAPQHPRTP
ncbi:hypothetical protein [Spirilliplanes yamanashiensis]|uniref:Uncharacterized protein n=1 Tax=Spirilliplanes yamanashiensis TaxID=42233 RepID=A0A8J3YB04_9ACTN|nr:hypothetical protein [Spirilliplanes yamanashiensis]MDP9817935.1 hypothetical protein [Spirilliplanes yamanashiensis]GIJ04744.1 hypothetical protein Sya03_40960 [Spirilliplanes yamanashiensis]